MYFIFLIQIKPGNHQQRCNAMRYLYLYRPPLSSHAPDYPITFVSCCPLYIIYLKVYAIEHVLNSGL